MYAISQCIALISLLCLCMSLWSKNKDKLLTLQIIEPVLSGIVDLMLNAYSGLICCIIAVFRNIFCKLHINKKVLLLVCCIAYLGYTLIFVNKIIDLLPIVASVIYAIVLIKSENIQLIRFVLIINSLLWCIYDCMFLNYISVFKDMIVIINGMISMFMHRVVIVIKAENAA